MCGLIIFLVILFALSSYLDMMHIRYEFSKTCFPPNNIIYSDSESKLLCVPPGRCLIQDIWNKHACTSQSYSSVTCTKLDPEYNISNLQYNISNVQYNISNLQYDISNIRFGICKCNFGYTGGYDHLSGNNNPCNCASDRNEKWSSDFFELLCLNSTQCTDNWHCYPKECYKQTRYSIGSCR